MRSHARSSLSALVLLVTTFLTASCVTPESAESVEVTWRQPEQRLLSSAMEHKPVPGWRLSVADLGLPQSGVDGAAATRFDASDVWFERSTLVGNVGDRAFFLARSNESFDTRFWFIGIDIHEGRPLFAAISLGIADVAPDCLLNGPSTVICVRTDGSMAWVIDTERGSITHSGPTPLRTRQARMGLVQVGIYAVAEDPDNGIHGVGPWAETTWFIPGSGSVESMGHPSDGSPLPPYAVQTASGRGNNQQVVFSLIDGTVVDPGASPDQRQLAARVYPGGFAIELTSEPEMKVYTPQEIVFFDAAGIRQSSIVLPDEEGGQLDTRSPDIPIIVDRDDSIVYGANGVPIARAPRTEGEVRLIGSSLFMYGKDDIGVEHQRRFDLRTGEEGQACEFDFATRFVGSDGTVGVFRVLDAPDVPVTAKARDLSTCEELWSIPGDNGSYTGLWQINTTLVQLSDDGTELMSLVAPG